jgi:hypothetical protein
MEKYGTAKQATDEDVVHAHCMLGNYSYRYTLRICNTYSFSVATMVTRTCLIVMYIRTLPIVLRPEFGLSNCESRN